MDLIDLSKRAASAKLNARSKTLARIDGRDLGLSRFSEHPRWEIHPGGDELLQLLEGELELTLLLGGEIQRLVMRPQTVFVVPRGIWHSPIPRGPVAILHLADYRGTKVSNAEDPRQEV